MTTPMPIRIGATNITGLGAVQLAQSLLPAFERLGDVHVETVYLPDTGPLAAWQPGPGTAAVPYRRTLPRSLSRAAECVAGQGFYAGASPLLMLGDIPVRAAARQAVFVQSPHLTGQGSQWPKYRFARGLFRANLRFADAFIVQTGAMRDALLETYPVDPARVHVIAQPPPEWLAAAGLRRTGRIEPGVPLSLFYPAAGYRHKNHRLLASVPADGSWDALVGEIVLTVDASPNRRLPFLRCIGRQPPAGVVAAYARADALLFLSDSESYGFPLVEAMTVGLPIVCPDLPYARTLCSDGAIYFDPSDAKSLHRALVDLRARLDSGWWPDWRAQLAAIPESWDSVARQMADVLRG